MALCDSCGQALPETYIKGDLIIRTNPYEALWRGSRFRISPTRARLLIAFIQLRRVSFGGLIATLPGEDSGEGALKAHITYLRRELDDAGVPATISSVWGWGYEMLWREDIHA